jgi:2-alkyl-3-oxoalkanoate reductase
VNILVTGANGFLGRYIVRQLAARSERVRVVCRKRDAEFDSLGLETVLADIREREKITAACAGMDAVIHVAAIAKMWGPWSEFYEINTLGTQHVIDGCRKHNVRRLVFTSSPSVTFAGEPQENTDESVPYPARWLAHYPHSKALAEQLLLAANGTDGLLTCALRPHLIWGPGDNHLLPRLLERARSGKLRRVGDGQNLIDTVYVENAAEAHLLALDRLMPNSPVAGSAYFITQGEPILLWDWVNQLLALAKIPPVVKGISLSAAYRIGWVMEKLWSILRRQSDPPMTRFIALQLGLPHYFDLTKARSELDYRPTISTAEGLLRLAADPIFWRSNSG